MKRFEYKTLKIKVTGFWNTELDLDHVDSTLNEMGSQGWELISIESKSISGSDYFYYYTFKREI